MDGTDIELRPNLRFIIQRDGNIQCGFMNPVVEMEFRPSAPITREEAVIIGQRLVEWGQKAVLK